MICKCRYRARGLAQGRAPDPTDLLIGAQKLDSLCKRGRTDRELLDVSLETLGLCAGPVTKACGVPRTRIERIMREESGISGDPAVRLGWLFGTSPDSG